MAAHTVLHDHLCALIDSTNSLALLACDELVDVVHTVLALEIVLAEDVIVRYVAVVTSRVASVCPMHPSSVTRSHDVAVDTGRGIISQVGMEPQQIEEESTQPHHDPAHEPESHLLAVA